MKLGICGHPSKLGGADTELWHQMKVWLAMGFELHVVHTGDLDANLRAIQLQEIPGVVLHPPRTWEAFKGMPVIAYCNQGFLQNISTIRSHASHVAWVNCMSWLFDAEIAAHRRGWIDAFIYQTERVMDQVRPRLEGVNPHLKQYLVKPYFDAGAFDFAPDPPDDKFRFCKISREDVGKYHPATMWLYETMVAPALKEGHILGWNPYKMPHAAGGNAPHWIKKERAGARDVREVYAKSHALIHFASPSQTENLPRVGFEAMATGTVLVVDNRGGWVDQVIDGETGWLCASDREFAYKASRCAFEKSERIAMAHAARQRLEDHWGMTAAQASWSAFFDQVL